MPLTCNIDAKGRFARLIYGIITLILGAVMMIFWARPSGSMWPWVWSAIVCAMGAFGIFEARAGWCIVRAMKFKTPM
jgi:hypothetical protein